MEITVKNTEVRLVLITREYADRRAAPSLCVTSGQCMVSVSPTPSNKNTSIQPMAQRWGVGSNSAMQRWASSSFN